MSKDNRAIDATPNPTGYVRPPDGWEPAHVTADVAAQLDAAVRGRIEVVAAGLRLTERRAALLVLGELGGDAIDVAAIDACRRVNEELVGALNQSQVLVRALSSQLALAMQWGGEALVGWDMERAQDDGARTVPFEEYERVCVSRASALGELSREAHARREAERLVDEMKTIGCARLAWSQCESAQRSAEQARDEATGARAGLTTAIRQREALAAEIADARVRLNRFVIGVSASASLSAHVAAIEKRLRVEQIEPGTRVEIAEGIGPLPPLPPLISELHQLVGLHCTIRGEGLHGVIAAVNEQASMADIKMFPPAPFDWCARPLTQLDVDLPRPSGGVVTGRMVGADRGGGGDPT